MTWVGTAGSSAESKPSTNKHLTHWPAGESPGRSAPHFAHFVTPGISGWCSQPCPTGKRGTGQASSLYIVYILVYIALSRLRLHPVWVRTPSTFRSRIFSLCRMPGAPLDEYSPYVTALLASPERLASFGCEASLSNSVLSLEIFRSGCANYAEATVACEIRCAWAGVEEELVWPTAV